MNNSKSGGGKTKAISGSDKVIHKFPDGTFITQTDLCHAETEMTAFFIHCVGVPYSAAIKGQVAREGIAKAKLIQKNPQVETWLEATINEQMYVATPGLSKKNLTDEERKDLQSGNTSPRALARKQRRGKIRDSHQYLAGRPKGWTLLNASSEAELYKQVSICYGVECANEVRQRNLFPYNMALHLLARKNRIESTRALAGKTKKKTNGLKRDKRSKTAKTPSKKVRG
jgi:hypothetical protein